MSSVCRELEELHDLRDRTLISLIQEQRLEHVVIEVGVVQAGPGAVRIKIHLQNLRLDYSRSWEAKIITWYKTLPNNLDSQIYQNTVYLHIYKANTCVYSEVQYKDKEMLLCLLVMLRLSWNLLSKKDKNFRNNKYQASKKDTEDILLNYVNKLGERSYKPWVRNVCAVIFYKLELHQFVLISLIFYGSIIHGWIILRLRIIPYEQPYWLDITSWTRGSRSPALTFWVGIMSWGGVFFGFLSPPLSPHSFLSFLLSFGLSHIPSDSFFPSPSLCFFPSLSFFSLPRSLSFASEAEGKQRALI